jgi:hypothetical protein
VSTPLWWGARGGGLAGLGRSSPVRSRSRRRPGGALPCAHKEEVCRRPGLLVQGRDEGRRSADGWPAAAAATAMATQRPAGAVPATMPRPWPCRGPMGRMAYISSPFEGHILLPTPIQLLYTSLLLMSHPIFRRKPSANLYACQDQVLCI